MNLNHDAIMSLVFTIGIFVSLPLIASICRSLGRAIVFYLVPSTIVLTVEGENDKKEPKMIKLKNTCAIAGAIKKAAGYTSPFDR